MTTSAFSPDQPDVPVMLGPQHLDEVMTFLSRDIVRNMFMLSWADNYGIAAPGQPDLFHFGGVHQGRRLTAVSLVITGRLILIESDDAGATERLADWYRRSHFQFEHIVSARDVVTPFWERYGDADRFATARLDRLQELYVVERRAWLGLLPTRADHVPTALQLATVEDIDSVFLASARMHEEETLEDPLQRDPGHFRRHVLHRIETDRTWVWFNEHRRLMFKADVSAQSRYGAQVSGVYTPPLMRGQGIGTRAMVDMCDALFKRGFPRIVLYVNDDNVAARRVYEKVGFAFHCPYETVFVSEEP
jgi:predicted GNAT family acetyltransferase